MEDLFRGRDFDLTAARRQLASEARRLGLPFGDRRMTYNSRKAQALGKWAESMGQGETFHRAVFEAYFAHGRNIAEPDVLLTLCEAIGLPTDVAAQAMKDPRFSAAVDSDWNRSRKAGVNAVPTFMAGGRRLVGAHPYSAIEALVLAAGAPRRSSAER